MILVSGMLGTENLGLFVFAGLLLNATPGPDTLYILGRTIAQGRRAGIASALGIGSGCICHAMAAAFGLSAILTTSAIAFTFVKWVGAAYLIYLGLGMLLERNRGAAVPELVLPAATTWAIYRQAVLTNLLNPKVALFFMAFLPQFVAPDSASKVGSFLFLGAVFVINGTLYCLGLVHCAAAVAVRLQRNAAVQRRTRRVAGVIFVGLGVRLAAQE
jgi:threonine/homoserine/homoserine lactone efflux protein